jgi:hypothetical protein
VLHRSPEGEASGITAVVVVFNQPMTAIGSGAPSARLEVTPPLPGTLRWVSTDTLKLELRERPRFATTYTVRLGAGIRAVSGKTLERDVVWQFATPVPRLRSAELVTRTRRCHPALIEPGDALLLSFNQPVGLEEIRRHVRLTVSGAEVAVTTEREPLQGRYSLVDETRVVLRPTRDLPALAVLSLSLRPGFLGLEGSRPAPRGAELSFGQRQPLTVKVLCYGKEINGPAARCGPPPTTEKGGILPGGLVIELSNPVPLSAVVGQLSLRPDAEDAKGRPRTAGWQPGWNRGETETCATRFEIQERLRKRTRYALEVRDRLRDVFEQPVTGPRAWSFETQGLQPELFVNGAPLRQQEELWVLESTRPLELRTVNVATVDLRWTVLGPDTFVPYLRCLSGERDPQTGERDPQQPAGLCLDRAGLGLTVQRRRLALQAPQDRSHRQTLALLPGGRTGGVVVLAATSPEVVDEKGHPVLTSRGFNHTGLDLHARLLPYSHLVWVTTLRDGRPVKGAQVEVRDATGRRLHTGVTGPSGLAELPGFADRARSKGEVPETYVWVSTPTDAAFAIPSREYHEVSGARGRTASGEWQGVGPHPVGFVATERGIYRPGETVHLHGVTRQWFQGQQSPLEATTLGLTLAADRDDSLLSTTVRTDAYGAFTAQVRLPDQVRLGGYSARLLLPGREEALAVASFKVEQFRVARFDVKVRLDSRELIAGDLLGGRIQGQYYSGSVMNGAPYRAVLRRVPLDVKLPGLERYLTGACDPEYPRSVAPGVIGSSRGLLTASGDDRFQHATAGECPAAYTLEAEVRDPSQAAVADRDRAVVHPAGLYVGVRQRPSRRTWKQITLDVVVADLKGKRLSSREVSLVVRTPPRTEVTDRFVPFDERTERWDWTQPHLLRTLAVGATGREVTFDYPLEHHEVLVSLAVTDRAGRTSRTDLQVHRPEPPLDHAGRPRWSALPPPEDEAKPADLEVTLDRPTYAPGQTALITVRSRKPLFSASLFVERERAFLATRLDASGRVARARFLVRDEHVGGLFVAVVAYPKGPLRHNLDDPVLPLQASAFIDVPDSVLGLDVALTTDRPRYRPGQEVTLSFAVTSPGRPAGEVELVVMAVDEAVLALTRYKLRNPRRSLILVPEGPLLTDERRGSLVPARLEGGVGFGGWGGFGKGGGGGGAGFGFYKMPPELRTRRIFATTPLHRLVRSGPDGRGTVRFRLPDDLTGYRIMAVAFDRERRAGTGETRFEVDKPVHLAPAMPRMLRVGDRFEGGVGVFNSGLPTGQAEVEVQVTGLKLTGPARLQVNVPPGGARDVRFALEATTPGQAKLVFRVRLAGETDALEHTVPVGVPILPETQAATGSTTATVREAIVSPGPVRPDFGGLDVSLSASLLTGASAGIDQLLSYPYECLEQRASRLLPLLAALGLRSRIPLSYPGDLAADAKRALAEIAAFQKREGGFTLWPRGQRPSMFLTAHVLVVLHRARLVGLELIPGVVARAVRYLREAISDPAARNHPLRAALLPLVAHALALHGERVEALVREAFPGRARLPRSSQAMLLSALAIELRAARTTPVPRPANGAALRPLTLLVDDLLRELGNLAKFEGDHAFVLEPPWSAGWELLDSNDRTTAQVLSAFLAARPAHPLVERLARYLVLGRKDAAGRRTSQFRTTQEAAHALLALWDYALVREATPRDLRARVWLGSRLLGDGARLEARAHSLRHHVPMADLHRALGQAGQPIVLENQGPGRLYYSARLTYSRLGRRITPISRGFILSREITLLDDEGYPASGRSPRKGDMVRVVTTVEVKEPRRYVVIDDPLPAGLEAIDPGLATTSRLGVPALTGVRSGPFDHRELRDDRVVHFVDSLPAGVHRYRYLARVVAPGVYAWPAARAEEMYSPEVYGITADAIFTAR